MRKLFVTMVLGLTIGLNTNAQPLANGYVASQQRNDPNAPKTETKTVKVGETVEFKGTIHGSVGIEDYLDYDKTAFDLEEDERYLNPDHENLLGGDKKSVTFKLTAKKAGTFTIKEMQNFRGNNTVRGITKLTVTSAKAKANKAQPQKKGTAKKGTKARKK